MNYTIRLVDIEDAAFILDLRNNPKLNRFISQTSLNVEDQINWIKAYKKRESEKKEFYFIILENGIKRGFYRLYNINHFSFTIGSWIFDKCKNKQLPILTDLVVSEYGFKSLKLPVLLLDVRKQNKKVINYHSLKAPLCFNEDEENFYYLIKSEDWENSKKNILNFFGIEISAYETFKIEN